MNEQYLSPAPLVSPIEQTPSVSQPKADGPLAQKPKFSLALIIGIVLFLLVAGGVVGFYVFKPQLMSLISKPTPTPSPAEVLMKVSTPTPDPTANWETYTNKYYGISLKYPKSFIVKDELLSLWGTLTLQENITVTNNGKSGNPYKITIYLRDARGYDKYVNFLASPEAAEEKRPITINGISGFELKSNGHRVILLPYHVNDIPDMGGLLIESQYMPQEDDLFNQIIQTFKFTN